MGRTVEKPSGYDENRQETWPTYGTSWSRRWATFLTRALTTSIMTNLWKRIALLKWKICFGNIYLLFGTWIWRANADWDRTIGLLCAFGFLKTSRCLPTYIMTICTIKFYCPLSMGVNYGVFRSLKEHLPSAIFISNPYERFADVPIA